MRRADASWTQPWGEWERIRDHHLAQLVRLRERTYDRREVDVRFRLFDDEIGFRYEVPAQGA